MATIQAENVVDFVRDTLSDLGKPDFTDIMTDIQKHWAMPILLKKNKAILESGKDIQFNVLVNHSNSARNVSLGQSDQLNTVDGMVQASMNWRNTVTSYPLIQQIVSMNREPARIVDYVKQQRIMAMTALVELMESNFWNAPSATDGVTPSGLPYWVPKSATKGFNGTVLSGYTTVAGLSPTTYPRWAAWTGPYTLVTRDDFIRVAREGATKTDFKPPVDGIPSPRTSSTPQFGWYTNYACLGQLEEACESQNDNLGRDLASMDGRTLFRRTDVNYVAKLDADTTNPFYGIDWSWFKTYFLRGWWMKETVIQNTPGQHTVSSYFTDMVYQFVSKNRRCHMVLSTGTTYPS